MKIVVKRMPDLGYFSYFKGNSRARTHPLIGALRADWCHAETLGARRKGFAQRNGEKEGENKIQWMRMEVLEGMIKKTWSKRQDPTYFIPI